MNIRGLSNITPIENQQKVEPTAVKTNESHQDRDADGRREPEDENKDPLNEEEMEQAKKHLDNLVGEQNTSLSYELETAGVIRIFVVKDHEGKVVRRIPEYEMRQLNSNKDESSGKLINRAG